MCQAWLTSEDAQLYRLSRQPDIVSMPVDGLAGADIVIDPQITYQSILGIGSSLEEASVYHLSRMSSPVRDDVLRSLVDPDEGVGWNLFRICFGTSDFTSQPYYSYDDMPAGQTDEALEHFTIQRDIDRHIVATMHRVLELNPGVRFFASPWSPPGWTKTTGSMCGGRVLPQYYDVVARYYAMAIQAYKSLGIPIYAMTLQNEPLMVHKGYPTCKFTWQEQKAFLYAVEAEFSRREIDTQIWIFDHNFRHAMQYPARILADKDAYRSVDGVAFHSYEGHPRAMTQLHNAYPDVDIYFTERSTWGTRGIDEILRYFRNWARSYNAWVTCLDDQQQPNPGPHPCSPTFVMVDRDNPDKYQYIPEYWLLGQISRFVKRGAVRIGSNYGSKQTVTNAAFCNPDGSIVLVVVNQTAEMQRFTAAVPDGLIETSLPPRTVGTYIC
jgi:glucosylceramidase